MSRPSTSATPLLIAAGLLGMALVGYALQSVQAEAEALLRARDESRLGHGYEALQDARNEAQEVAGKALAEVARLPTVKAAAGTRDPLTLAENLVEATESLPGPLHAWVLPAPGGGGRAALVLDRGAEPPTAYVDASAAADPKAVDLGFGGDAPDDLPAALPISRWPVAPIPSSYSDSSLAAALEGAATTQATTHAATGEALPWVPVAGRRDLQPWVGAAAPLAYGDRVFLGVLAAAQPLSQVLDQAAQDAGVSVEIQTSETQPRVTDGATSKVHRRAFPRPDGSWWIVGVPRQTDWSTLGLGELLRPLFRLLVGLLALGLLAIPLGAWFWSQRPPAPRPTTSGGITADNIPTEESTRPGWGRSAVAQVLDRYPEDRFGKPTSLGAGGMGMVLKLVDSKLGRPIALKIMTMGDADPEVMASLRRRFLREAQSMATLSHPGLPRIYDVEEDPAPHFAMEFIQGRSLQEVYEEDGVQDADAVRAWLGSAADALTHAHERGIVHRDIKPDNLMLEASGQIRVIDFGIALVEESTRVTKEGFFVGTMGFISPEQLAHGEVDERADVYSLAATGYFLLSGKYPYTTPQLAVGEGFEPAPLPEAVPEALAGALAAALHMKQAERPATMGAFRASLGLEDAD